MMMLNRFRFRFALLLAASGAPPVVMSFSTSSTTVMAPSSKRLSFRSPFAPSSQPLSFHQLEMATTNEEENVEFDLLVNKNAQGARQDMEERTERLNLDISKTTYSATVKSPPDGYISFAEKGASNAHLPKRKILHQSILGGCYVGFGGLIALMIAGNLGGLAAGSPGVSKMAFAALFPVNLLLILSTSGQLFTGNSATVAAAKFEGFVSWKDMWASFGLSMLGNIIGCALFAQATMWAQVMNPGSTSLCIKTAVGKCCATGIVGTMLKAIMCNWMVSMAVWLATQANDLPGKMVACYLPISTFVGIGLEHSIANLYILPLALMVGAPLTLTTVICNNLIPVIIGNGIAGALIVAASYSYQYGRLGGLQRALFQEKLANIKKDLALKREQMDLYQQFQATMLGQQATFMINGLVSRSQQTPRPSLFGEAGTVDGTSA